MVTTDEPPQPRAIRHDPLVPVIAGVCGALVMTAALGPAQVYPPNVEWVMRGDYHVHFFGWHLFRTGPWTLPLGATPHLLWPVGSSVGLTDSIPIAAVFFKLLSNLLPPLFQYLGLWLVLCFALQGVFGALLMQLVTPRPLLQWLGAMLFILSPPLIIRFGHPALVAQWVLLAALWLSLQPDADRVSAKRAIAWALLAAATAAIQPYLLLMVAVLLCAAGLRQFIASPRQIVPISVHAAVGLGAAWVALWQSGSLSVSGDDGLTMGGFGAYSANLLTFVMPSESQSLFAPGPFRYASPLQYEGYAYLGAGTLLLGVIAIVSKLATPRPSDWWAALRRHWPLVLALLFLAAMGLGPAITIGARTVFTYDGWFWGPLLAFRSSGRMVWPLHYALITAFAFAATRFSHRTALAVLGLAVAVQVADVAGMARDVHSVGDYGFLNPLESRFWNVAPKYYQRIILIPPNICDRNGAVEIRAFSLIAGRDGLAINAGSASRHDERRSAEYCGELDRDIHDGLSTPGSLYVVRPDLLPTLVPAGTPDTPVCALIDGYGVCFSAGSYAQWRGQFELPDAVLVRRSQ